MKFVIKQFMKNYINSFSYVGILEWNNHHLGNSGRTKCSRNITKVTSKIAVIPNSTPN